MDVMSVVVIIAALVLLGLGLAGLYHHSHSKLVTAIRADVQSIKTAAAPAVRKLESDVTLGITALITQIRDDVAAVKAKVGAKTDAEVAKLKQDLADAEAVASAAAAAHDAASQALADAKAQQATTVVVVPVAATSAAA